jgi:hypothetical protein
MCLFSMLQQGRSLSADQPEENGRDVLVRGGDLEVAPGLETHKVNAPVPPKASLQDPATTALLSANASEAQPLLPTFRRKRSRLYWIRKVAILLIVFSASLSVVVILFMHLPTIEHIAGDDEQIVLKVPTTLEELKIFRDVMDRYQVSETICYHHLPDRGQMQRQSGSLLPHINGARSCICDSCASRCRAIPGTLPEPAFHFAEKPALKECSSEAYHLCQR